MLAGLIIGLTEWILIFLPLIVLIAIARFPALRRAMGLTMMAAGVIASFTFPFLGAVVGIPLFFVGERRAVVKVRCPNCGKLNSENARYCSRCGQKLQC